VTRRPAVIEVGVAIAIAALIFVLQPGVAFGALLALLVLLVCAASLAFDRRRARRPRRR
jgi:hypothetical protein